MHVFAPVGVSAFIHYGAYLPTHYQCAPSVAKPTYLPATQGRAWAHWFINLICVFADGADARLRQRHPRGGRNVAGGVGGHVAARHGIAGLAQQPGRAHQRGSLVGIVRRLDAGGAGGAALPSMAGPESE